MASWREPGWGALAIALTACSALPSNGADNAATAPRAGTVQAGPDGAVALAAIEDAVLDDALRAWPGLQRRQLEVRSEAVTWPDGSLGCAQPGRVYTQALIAGWRLLVRGAGRKAVYHASRRGHWVRCPTAMAAPAPPRALTR